MKRHWRYGIVLGCFALPTLSVDAVPSPLLQDIWVEHLLFRSREAESPLQSEQEMRLMLHVAPRDARGLLALAEEYMQQKHWLGTAMLARLGNHWYPEDDAFAVFDEETTALLNLNSRAADVPGNALNALLGALQQLPAEERGQHLLAFEIEKLRPLLSTYPHSKDLLLILSQVYQGRQEWSLLCAVNLYALDVAGDTIPFINNLILGLTELGLYAEADRWALEWLERYPAARVLRAHHALLAIRMGKAAAEQVEALGAWIEVDPDNLQPHTLRARAYMNLGQWANAERDLFSCIRLNPELPQTYLDLVNLALNEEDPQQAAGWLKKYQRLVTARDYRRQISRMQQDERFRKAGLGEH